MAIKEKEKLDQWLKRLNDKDMPLLAKTSHELSRLTSDDNSPLSAVVSIILQDPGMTARVLRLANSAYYTSSSYRELSTISRAILILGINEIKSICMFSAIISDLLKGKPRDRLIEEIAISFHSAVQAKRIAILKGDKEPEEIFIASLLYNIGEMAFLCFGGREVEHLQSELETSPQSKASSIEMKVLGFKIKDISVSLSKTWNLGSLLENTLFDPNSNTRTKEIALSHKFVRCLEKGGWGNQDANRVLQEISRELSISAENLQSVIESSATEAANIAKMYGVGVAAKRICLPYGTISETDASEEKCHISDTDNIVSNSFDKEILKPDPILQLKILRDLASISHTRSDIGQVLQLAMEGIYRGVGMERVLFAVLTPDRNFLIGKSAMGINVIGFADSFVVGVSNRENSLFSNCLQSRNFTWYKSGEYNTAQKNSIYSIPQNLYTSLGKEDFFIAPVLVNNKAIGIFYADRQVSKNALEQESFDAFQHFAIQCNVILNCIGQKRPS